jgi:hypothetical protein
MSDFNNGAMLGAINAKIDQAIRELREMRRAMDKKSIPRGEAWIKTFLSIAAPTATLFATGSVTKALEVMALFAGR